jgi:Zn-dependent M28 family amino/carboxypeptidase
MTYLSADLFVEALAHLTEEQVLSRSNISNHVWMLAGDIGARSLTRAPNGLHKSAEYIEYVFKKIGYNPVDQVFSAEVYNLAGSQRQPPVIHQTRNIIAELKGATSAEEIIVVGAHYDTEYSSPGANDNATGVAALLEIARVLYANQQAEHTIRFVAFTNEEQPFCRTNQMGSKVYADACKDRNEKIKAMICLETIGCYTEEPGTQNFPDPTFESLGHDIGNFIAFVSNVASESLLKKCVTSFRRLVRFPSIAVAASENVRGIDYSDHQNFWQLGYPALMITDTAFYRYPHYHEKTDTPDKVDFDRLAVVTGAIAEMIIDLTKASV